MKSSVIMNYSEAFWRRLITRRDSRRRLTAITWGLVSLIGLADFLLGFEVSLLVFYFIPIALAVIARGWKFGVGIALVSVASWIGGDMAAGAHYASRVVPIWNVAIVLLTFLVLIQLLASFLNLQRDLEHRVTQRTSALASEIAERERLEKVVIEISERERRSIGHDLHDGLGQHLTGTALTAQLLVESLAERQASEAVEAIKVVTLIKSAIGQTRQMAKGLLLADIDVDGLTSALQEFCAATTEQFRVACTFDGNDESRLALSENGAATQLYRIAQEAIRNAVRHGNAKNIEVRLVRSGPTLILTVRDDGRGLPPPEARGPGLGLRIMRHRAKIISATFTIDPVAPRGTVITCALNVSPA
ncbi:MAG: sensor histidine kinase [Lacunisphaera sp.]